MIKAHTLLRQISLCVGIYIFVCVLLFFIQRSFIYFPEHGYQSPSDVTGNTSLQELTVTTSDGLELKGWYAEAKSKKYTLIFFHGNGDNLMRTAGIADPFVKEGYGVLLAEYRGYSNNPGAASELGLYRDGRAFIEALRANMVSSRDIVLYGHSLGSGVATQLATEYPELGGLILLAPFTSLTDIAALRFKIFPVNMMLEDHYDNYSKIEQINCPLLIAAGEKDTVIPSQYSKSLFDHALVPKSYHSFPEGGHNDMFNDMAGIALDWLEKLPEMARP